METADAICHLFLEPPAPRRNAGATGTPIRRHPLSVLSPWAAVRWPRSGVFFLFLFLLLCQVQRSILLSLQGPALGPTLVAPRTPPSVRGPRKSPDSAGYTREPTRGRA